MPPVKRQRPTRAVAAVKSASRNGAVGNTADVTPEELGAIRASTQGKEQAPTSRQQAGINANWARVRDQLGDPFDVERIPLSRLRFMRRDPMLGFGLSFIKTPIARAKWFIQAKDANGPNAQVAANVDWALRRIFASYVFQWSNILDFGFSAIAKRYENRVPTGTYLDPGQGDGTATSASEQPLWSEGGIQPLVWKPFIALSPEVVEPIWTGSGDFNGIQYKQESGADSGGGSDKNEFKIDVYHSLWATHAKEENFGSIFGYPRLGYAYRYWWSYWFRWAIADQAFEKKSDPGVIVRHPDGFYEEIPGNPATAVSYRDYALDMGERLRAGATISLPSDVHMGEIDGKPSAVPLWDVQPLKDLINFDPFDKSFEYLDIMKLRSLWIPEQAFLEGKGGTSSRNVAATMTSSFTESQDVLAKQFVETVNRWIIPQFLANNFPEFLAANGTAECVIQGFADQDIDARNQAFQLLAQQDFGARKFLQFLDVKKMAEDAGLPILSFKEQQQVQAELEKEKQLELGPAQGVEPVPGQSVGVIPGATGFSYVQPREIIYLSDNTANFMDKLPATMHYTDPQVRKAARELWQEWHSLYADEYNSFADYLAELGDITELAEPTEKVSKLARRIVKQWESNLDRLGKVVERTSSIYKKVLERSSRVEAEKADIDAYPAPEVMDLWIERHAGEFISGVEFTTREELTGFLARKITDGIEDPKELANAVREHFSDFPGWKADRLARTEIAAAYNGGVLLTAQANGVSTVQAVDGTGDEDCINRNGQLFDVQDAMGERDHPNGTLGWRILPVELSWEISEEVEPGEAIYDEETTTLLFSNSSTSADRNSVMLEFGDSLMNGLELIA